jgi:hypothetical protein
MQIDSDPTERALRQAIKRQAQAAFDGERDALRAARKEVAAAIAAFPQDKQEPLASMAQRRVREELNLLHSRRADEMAAAEARALADMREQYDRIRERDGGRKR